MTFKKPSSLQNSKHVDLAVKFDDTNLYLHDIFIIDYS